MVAYIQELPVGEIKDVLTVTDITVAGILLAVIIVLLYDKYKTAKRHDKQVEDVHSPKRGKRENRRFGLGVQQ